MRSVAYQNPLPIADERSLVDWDAPEPKPAGRDLLVEIRAVSVNPVDTKVRKGVKPDAGGFKILGWDASGVVIGRGPDARMFDVGDEVFYSGAFERPGTNAERHLVDERIVGQKPKRLSFAEAAALPLTTITAWEALFDRLAVARAAPGGDRAILIIGGAGGVGSIATQLARQLTDLTVIATASRPETEAWSRDLGAHHVVNHREPLAAQMERLRISPAFVFSTTGTAGHLQDIAALIAPQGRFGVIDDPATLDINPFKRKSVSVHWEFMFTRSMFETPDILRQHEILTETSQLIDAGTLRTTLSETFGPINAANLRRAHALIESGAARGKIVLEGFGQG